VIRNAAKDRDQNLENDEKDQSLENVKRTLLCPK
jgi:hypothetical protein